MKDLMLTIKVLAVAQEAVPNQMELVRVTVAEAVLPDKVMLGDLRELLGQVRVVVVQAGLEAAYLAEQVQVALVFKIQ